MKRIIAACAGIGMVAASLGAGPATAETKTVRMGGQYGLTYLPFAVVEHEKLIEKNAKALGLGDIKAEWVRSAGGTTQNDALLSGNLDFAATGYPSFFLLWSRGRGKFDIKALASYGSTPLLLVTRDPNVKTIKDFSQKNRIALPAVKSSVQAIFLQMYAEKNLGKFDALDGITVSRAHPDAMVAVLSGRGEIDSAFSAPPFQHQLLAAPGIHLVASGNDLFGGPSSNGVLYLTERFHKENPKTVTAVFNALKEALDLISKDKKRAAEIYLAVSGDKLGAAEVLRTIDAKDTIYDAVPRGTMKFAEFMQRNGSIPTAPKSWKDVFFEEAHSLPGN